jgi:NAD(P)-dependent dehydrogenase (short-subunit alcohol dehydrogenase family)
VAEVSFTGCTVVITNAGAGLGLAIARRFGQAGAHAVITEVDAVAGERAVETLRREALSASFALLDMRDPAQSLRLIDMLARERGPIDVWVNNPMGLLHTGLAESLPREGWDSTLAFVLSGTFYCAQAVGRQMLTRGRGVIINVVSAEGFRPIEGRVAHSTGAAGMIMLTKALGIEWATRGVRVVGIATGVEMAEGSRESTLAAIDADERPQCRIPMRRRGTVEEISDSVLYLASDTAKYIVAETLRVDGGWVAYQLF